MTTQSILSDLIEAHQNGQPATFGLSPFISTPKGSALAIGIDDGNDAYKGAVLSEQGKLVTVRIPTAYREAEVFQSGEGEITYTVDNTSFWIGEVALRHEGDALPIGPTDQRLIDARMRHFLAAATVELLYTAGYAPETYLTAVCFEIPDAEIVPLPDESGKSDKMGVCEATRASLTKYLQGQTITIIRTDKRGVETTWTLVTVRVLPQAQTAGTILAWSKATNGKTVTDHEAVTVINIGGGDLYRTDVNFRPYQMSSRRVSDGTISIARALARKFPRSELSDVGAQNALITERLMISGKMKEIGNERREVIASQGQDLIGRLLPVFQQTRRFVLVTGGGVILLHDQLVERLEATGKVRGEDYELINHGMSSTLNSIGALFSLLFFGAKKG